MDGGAWLHKGYLLYINTHTHNRLLGWNLDHDMILIRRGRMICLLLNPSRGVTNDKRRRQGQHVTIIFQLKSQIVFWEISFFLLPRRPGTAVIYKVIHNFGFMYARCTICSLCSNCFRQEICSESWINCNSIVPQGIILI